MLKGPLHQGGESFGPCARAYYVNFQFPHICIHPFCPTNYKKLQNIFNVVTKQRQNWNTERIMQFFKIAAYVHIARLYSLVHYAVCAFFALYKLLAVCACGCISLGCLCNLDLHKHWVRESVSVFDGFVYL